MNRACFLPPEPQDPNVIPFVLTQKERDWAAWMTVHLEALRRERNRRDAARTEDLA